jgi:predicted enzyme related to lactoylglutathione lyase
MAGRASLSYVEAVDLKGTLAKVEKLGGKTVMPPMQAGPVEIAMFADPEGNVIGLAKGM